MTTDKNGKLSFSLMEVITLLVTIIGLMLGWLAYTETKRDNALDELATVIQMSEPQQVKYLANKDYIN